MTSQRNRAVTRWRMCYYGNVMTTRWRICVTMATLFYIFNSTVIDWTCLIFFPPISAAVFLYVYCKQQDSTVTVRVFRWSASYFLSYFTQTFISLTKVSKNCQPRISRKSIQQEPSSSMQKERHGKANSCFSCPVIWNYYPTPSVFSDINTLHVRLNYYFIFCYLMP